MQNSNVQDNKKSNKLDLHVYREILQSHIASVIHHKETMVAQYLGYDVCVSAFVCVIYEIT